MIRVVQKGFWGEITRGKKKKRITKKKKKRL